MHFELVIKTKQGRTRKEWKEKEIGGAKTNPAMVIKSFNTSVAGSAVLAMFSDLEEKRYQMGVAYKM